MAHPMNHLRDHKVQHSRVSDITAACGGGMSSGGAAGAISKQKALYPAMKKSTLRATGGAVKARSDRPARAFGGRLGKKKGSGKGGKHTVNVIIGHPGGSAPPAPGIPPTVPGVAAGAPPSPAAPPPMPPRPPMMAGPPPPGPMGGPPGMSGMPPPGVPRPGMPMRKRGGAVSTSSNAGISVGETKISRDFPSNKDDTPNIGRKAVITKATGGPIDSTSKGGTHMGPMFMGGSMGGIAKLQKMERTKKTGFGKATREAMNPTQNPKPGTGRG
jgi:hypothetical protein